MTVSGKQLVKELMKRGWELKGRRGSHAKMVKGELLTIIPVHGNRDMGKGMIRAIEKQTGEKLV